MATQKLKPARGTEAAILASTPDNNSVAITTDTTPRKLYVYQGGTWYEVAGAGAAGEDGRDGVSFLLPDFEPYVAPLRGKRGATGATGTTGATGARGRDGRNPLILHDDPSTVYPRRTSAREVGSRLTLGGTFASLPVGGGLSQRIYIPTDSPYMLLKDKGTAYGYAENYYDWDHYLPLAGKIDPVPFNHVSQLNGAINNSTTTVISWYSGIPPSIGAPVAPFMIQIDSEVMLVTAVSGTTLTVTRAYGGTSAASHSDLATLTYLAWRWDNQGTATETYDYGGHLMVQDTQNASVHAMNILYRPVPTVAYTITMAFMPKWQPLGYGLMGWGHRLQSSQDLKMNLLCGVDASTTVNWYRHYYTSATTYSSAATLASYHGNMISPLIWVRTRDDLTNITASVSTDNRNYELLYSEARATGIGAPDQFCWGVDPYTKKTSMHLVSWKCEV